MLLCCILILKSCSKKLWILSRWILSNFQPYNNVTTVANVVNVANVAKIVNVANVATVATAATAANVVSVKFDCQCFVTNVTQSAQPFPSLTHVEESHSHRQTGHLLPKSIAAPPSLLYIAQCTPAACSKP